jgi:hypothetical protein
MPAPPPNAAASETLRQIQAAWDEAQAQLAVLREQVEHATTIAQAKVTSNLLEREMDRSYRDLGEAVWAEVSKGKLQLPSNMTAVRKALEKVTEKIRAQNSAINDLLAEGEDLAKRIQQNLKAASKAVAKTPQKR